VATHTQGKGTPKGKGTPTKGKGKGVTKLVLARQLIDTLANHYPDRTIHVVADAAYATGQLAGLPSRVSVTCRLRKNAVLFDLAPPRTGKQGRPHAKETGWAPPPTWPRPRSGTR
jgi:hypothetical protein